MLIPKFGGAEAFVNKRSILFTSHKINSGIFKYIDNSRDFNFLLNVVDKFKEKIIPYFYREDDMLVIKIDNELIRRITER